VIERLAGASAVDALAAPAFALDVLAAARPGAEVAVVGRVLDFIRLHADAAAPARVLAAAPAMTVAEAVAEYDRRAQAPMAKGTQHTYGTWTKRHTTAPTAR
jgi:hypothetical protein